MIRRRLDIPNLINYQLYQSYGHVLLCEAFREQMDVHATSSVMLADEVFRYIRKLMVIE
jgi:hypothetical protein